MVGIHCQNYNQELINGIKENIGSPGGYGHLFKAPAVAIAGNIAYDIEYNQIPAEKAKVAGEAEGPGKQAKTIALDLLESLKFGRKAIKVSLTSVVTSEKATATYAAVLGYREGGRYKTVGGLGFGHALMAQQYNEYTERRFRAELLAFPILFAFMPSHEEIKKYIPRNLNHVEEAEIRKTVLNQAVSKLYNRMVQVTGLSSSFSGLGSGLGASYIPHADALRTMYGTVNFEGFNIDGIPSDLLGDASKFFSRGQISDQHVIRRIAEVAASTQRSAFLYAADPEKLYLISVQKASDGFNAQMTVFGLPHNLPVGAFATSVGSWNIESRGAPANPSIDAITGVFPPSK
jgi:hypothetical protein